MNLYLLLFTTVLTLTVNADKLAQPADPSLPPVKLSEEDIKKIKPVQSVKPAVVPAKKLFARQCTRVCRDTGDCVGADRQCCIGYQCYQQDMCCGNGCVAAGSSCCESGDHCPPGELCMKWVDTGVEFCQEAGGSARTQRQGGGFAITSTSWSTSRTTYRTTRTSTSIDSTPTCLVSSHDLCPDEKFCCPSNSICYYDMHNVARCWDGSTNYYTYRWYYSWSYSFGVRWYRTTTSVYITQDYSDVLTLSAPTPTSPPPTTEAVDPPKTTTTSTGPLETADALSGGSPPDPEDSVDSENDEENPSPTTSDPFSPEETLRSAADGLQFGRCGYMLGALMVAALGAVMA